MGQSLKSFARGGYVSDMNRLGFNTGGLAIKETSSEILENNPDVPFVKRINNPQNYPHPKKNEEGKISTHLLSAETDEDGNSWVFPTIVPEGYGYKRYANTKEDRTQALNDAKSSGNAIQFSNITDAVKFTESYKTDEFNKHYEQMDTLVSADTYNPKNYPAYNKKRIGQLRHGPIPEEVSTWDKYEQVGESLLTGFINHIRGQVKAFELTGLENRLSLIEQIKKGNLKRITKGDFTAPLYFKDSQGNKQKVSEENKDQAIQYHINKITDGKRFAGSDWVGSFLPNMLDNNPRLRDSFFLSKVPQGTGSAIAFIAETFLIGKGAGMFSKADKLSKASKVSNFALFATQGSLSQKTASFEDAIDDGATLKEAFKAGDIGSLIGLTEAVPLATILNRINRATKGTITKTLKNMLVEGTEEAAQEAFQTIMTNLTASTFVAYNPDRKWFQGAEEGAEVGFTVGGLLSFLSSMVQGKRMKRGSVSSQSVPIPQEILDTEVTSIKDDETSKDDSSFRIMRKDGKYNITSVKKKSYDSDGDVMQIISARVDKTLQNKGVGTKLYQAAIQDAKSRGLDVVSDAVVSEFSMARWKKLEKMGYDVEFNENVYTWTDSHSVQQTTPTNANEYVVKVRTDRPDLKRGDDDEKKDTTLYSTFEGEIVDVADEFLSTDEALKQARKIPFFNALPLNKVKSLFNDQGNVAWGKFSRGIITFVENPHRTTLPHETYHAFSNLVLSDKKRGQMYKAIRLRDGDGISDYNAEESLSVEFSEWFVADKQPKTFIEKAFRVIKNKMLQMTGAIKDDSKLGYSFNNSSVKQQAKIENVFIKLMNPKLANVKVEGDFKEQQKLRSNYQENPKEFTTKMSNALEASGKKEVKRSHLEQIKNVLKSKSLKGAELRLIEDTLSLEQFKDSDTINVQNFITAMEEDLLDFQIIRTDSSNTYGLESIGFNIDAVKDKAKTVIINTDFDLGDVDHHFSAEFRGNLTSEDVHIKKIEAGTHTDINGDIQNLAEDTFLVLKKDYNTDNITSSYIASFTSQEEADYFVRVNVPKLKSRPNGFFGHFRYVLTEEDGKLVFNLVEYQSDTYQKKLDWLLKKTLRTKEEWGEQQLHDYREHPDNPPRILKILNDIENYAVDASRLAKAEELAPANRQLTVEGVPLSNTEDFRQGYKDSPLLKKHEILALESPSTIFIDDEVDNRFEYLQSGMGIGEDLGEYFPDSFDPAKGGEEFDAFDESHIDLAIDLITEVIRLDEAGIQKDVDERSEREYWNKSTGQRKIVSKYSSESYYIKAMLNDKLPWNPKYIGSQEFTAIDDMLQEANQPAVSQAMMLAAMSLDYTAIREQGNISDKDSFVERVNDLLNGRVNSYDFFKPVSNVDGWLLSQEDLESTDGTSKIEKYVHKTTGYEVFTEDGYDDAKPTVREMVLSSLNLPLEFSKAKAIATFANTTPGSFVHQRYNSLNEALEIADKEQAKIEKELNKPLNLKDKKEIKKAQEFRERRQTYYELILRTAMREAGILNADIIRFPTPMTLSFVESYGVIENTDDVNVITNYEPGDLSLGDAVVNHLGIQGLVTEISDDSYFIATVDENSLLAERLTAGVNRAPYVWIKSSEKQLKKDEWAKYQEAEKKIRDFAATGEGITLEEAELHSHYKDIVSSGWEGENWNPLNDHYLISNSNENDIISWDKDGERYWAWAQFSSGKNQHKAIKLSGNREGFKGTALSKDNFKLGQISYKPNALIAHNYGDNTADPSVKILNKESEKKNATALFGYHELLPSKRVTKFKGEIPFKKIGKYYKYISKRRKALSTKDNPTYLKNVTDSRGFTWYESNVVPADKGAIERYQIDEESNKTAQEKKKRFTLDRGGEKVIVILDKVLEHSYMVTITGEGKGSQEISKQRFHQLLNTGKLKKNFRRGGLVTQMTALSLGA